MKRWMAVLIFAVAAVLLLSVTKDIIIRFSAEQAVKVVTGCSLRIKSFRVGLVRHIVAANNLRLLNPKGYKDRVMINMPLVYVDYDPLTMFKGRVHLNQLRINLEEFVVIKNPDGELNIDALNVIKAKKEGRRPEEKARGRAPKVQIDNLELKIGRAVYKDYSRGTQPFVREYNINLDERYTNVSDPYSLLSLIVVKALRDTAIPELINFDIMGLQKSVTGILGTARKIVGGAVTGVAQTGWGVVTQAAEGLEKAAEDLTGGLFKK